MTNEWVNLVQDISTPVAAIAAAISAWMAARAVHDSRTSAEEERESRRPYFSFERGEVRPAREPRRADNSQEPAVIEGRVEFHGNLLNRGLRPASNTRAKVVVQDMNFGTVPVMMIEEVMADDFPHGIDWHLMFGHLNVPPDNANCPPLYVVVGVRYDDLITQKHYSQLFVMKWQGIQNGVFSGDIAAGTQVERQQFIENRGNLIEDYL